MPKGDQSKNPNGRADEDAVASGAAGTFGHSYWTLAYLRLTTPTETAPTGTTPPPDSSPSLG